MEAKQIKDLMAAMGRTGIKRLVLKREDFELEIERETQGGIVRYSDQYLESGEENPLRNDIEFHRSQGFAKRSGRESDEDKKGALVEELSDFITSPMVGTFYATPSPEDPSFVKPGDRVELDTIVCIIEAMKVMNDVKAGIKGIVVEALVENGQPIEFGTKLFRINAD